VSAFTKLIKDQKKQASKKKNRFNLEANTNANRVGLYCACGSKKSYKLCCSRIHKNIYLATSPLALMKSRYVAFVMGDIDFLMLSHHSSTRPDQEKDEILRWTQSINWSNLEITEVEPVHQQEGFVSFKASYTDKDVPHVIYEKSRFVIENNHWTYIDGIHF